MILAEQKDMRRDLTGKRSIYVVGSLNGSVDLLTRIIEEIEYSGTFARDDKIVFMGNFIGVGDTEGVIDTLKDYQSKRPGQAIILRGPNEQRMAGLRRSFYLTPFGRRTLHSYSTRPSLYVGACRSLHVGAFVKDAQWLDTLPYAYRTKKYFITHAGIDPEVPLDKQCIPKLLYQHEAILKNTKPLSHTIIHSHPFKNDYGQSRIGIGSATSKVVHAIQLDDTTENETVEDILELSID